MRYYYFAGATLAIQWLKCGGMWMALWRRIIKDSSADEKSKWCCHSLGCSRTACQPRCCCCCSSRRLSTALQDRMIDSRHQSATDDCQWHHSWRLSASMNFIFAANDCWTSAHGHPSTTTMNYFTITTTIITITITISLRTIRYGRFTCAQKLTRWPA